MLIKGAADGAADEELPHNTNLFSTGTEHAEESQIGHHSVEYIW